MFGSSFRRTTAITRRYAAEASGAGAQTADVPVVSSSTGTRSSSDEKNNNRNEALMDIVDRFNTHWRGAIKGQAADISAFRDLIVGGDGSKGGTKWENPVVSTTQEYIEGLAQFTNFFTEPTLTIFNSAYDSNTNIASIGYQLSFWYPTFWRPRIIIPGKLLLKFSEDVNMNIVGVNDTWEISLLDIFSKQFLPRLWDVWHILQTPCPEYVPVREVKRLGDVTISAISETICAEARWCGATKFPGPSVLTAASFSLFGKLGTSRPVRDPIYTVLPIEVQSSRYIDSAHISPLPAAPAISPVQGVSAADSGLIQGLEEASRGSKPSKWEFGWHL